jgi:hypothetical protein
VSRFDSSANETAAAQPHVPYVLLGEFDFASGFVRVNSADRFYTHNGQEFGPLGTLAGIGPIKENGNLIPEKLDFQLSGVNNSLITTTITEDYHNRDVRVWLAYLDEDYRFIDTPHLLWEGLMDTMAIRREKNRSMIGLTAENRLIRWNQTAGWTYTWEHQRVFDATDDFLDQVAALVNKVTKWNEQTVSTGRGPGDGGPPRNDYER